MANTQTLKRRIRSVKNTRQITKAMELVSASKMRRATESTAKSRPFRNITVEVLARLREITDVSLHPLFESRVTKSRLFIIFSSDRGLAGAYNSNLYRRLVADIESHATAGVSSKVIVLGKQGARFLSRVQGVDVIAAYPALSDQPRPREIRPLLEQVTHMFLDKQVDVVDILYTDYKSSLLQVVEVFRLLPAAFSKTDTTDSPEDVIIEPSARAVLDQVATRFVEVQLWQTLLEAQASEHSMRLIAMKSASDNASEIIDDLTLAFNTARQAAITQELAEITGGAEAMK
jgi:F-type H+-transporting ATPase subunit gamma